MNQREAKKHKIERSWQTAYEHKQQVKKLKKVSDKFYSSNSNKNQYLYETEWTEIDAGENDEALKDILQFKNFPDDLIPFIKVNLLFKTHDNQIENHPDDFWFDFYYSLEQTVEEDTPILTIFTFTKGALFYKILISIINVKGYHEIQTYKT